MINSSYVLSTVSALETEKKSNFNKCVGCEAKRP